MKKNNLLLAASLGALALASCGKSGPKKTPGGIDFTIEKAGSGEKLKVGDTVLVHFTSYLNDSLLMSSHQQGSNAIPLVISESRDKYDLMDGFAMLTEGDSAVFVMPVDSMPQMPPMAKKGDVMKVAFLVETKYSAAKQNAKEEKEIEEYTKKNSLTTTKSPKGVYIAVTQEGTGEQPKAGDEVTVNYTGKLLDGAKFDSNVDSTVRPGMPLEPLKFNVGEGRVIPGWDDALAQLKKGAKATLVIPSSLAYGLQGSGPIIKPNSVLVFDVELLDVKPGASAAAPAPAKYFVNESL
ncbi:MAG: FKBP-type peptidyl-prolyl cis-trans isomerase [Chitinophaga sp.]